ncbi:hypothetical protein CTA2_5495 [Colletotrichum tanaceti]|nr:hypothetical protein CTA2_5494 [Colletotrichum tanaceti]KAJ0166873.1 hypothetical protein CTA2_5495 [Colletotrichum tanaceti]
MEVLIWVRSALRVVEYLEGKKGRLMTNEAYVYVFDANAHVPRHGVDELVPPERDRPAAAR